MNIQNILFNANKILNNHNVKTAKLDCELLLSEVINKDRQYLILNSQKILKEKQINIFDHFIERRKKGEPIAYLINKKDFWKETFYVDRNVLIPRPDTEHLVEETLKLSKNNSKLHILDIGTGSGCILLSILNERKTFYGTGIDISQKAINVAKYNAKLLNINNRVKFYNSDVDKFLIGKYDLILSNPPYIKNSNLKYLEKDVSGFEPKLALDGGNDGFHKIIKVVNKSSNLIKKKGKLILEIGFEQKNKVLKILKKYGFYTNKVLKDYGKNDRCIISTKI